MPWRGASVRSYEVGNLPATNNPDKHNFRWEEPGPVGSPGQGEKCFGDERKNELDLFPFHGPEGHLVVDGRATGIGERYALPNGRVTN